MEHITYESPLKSRYASKEMTEIFAQHEAWQNPLDYLKETEEELLIYQSGLDILLPKLAKCVDRLSKFAEAYKNLPTLGYTHLQAAQLTTVGKRACLWLADLLADLQDMERVRNDLALVNNRGTSDSGASFATASLSEEKLSEIVPNLAELQKVIENSNITTKQTHRLAISSCLGTLCASIHKICFDIRILAHEKEIEEPFEKTQIGSSAMAYKRNPMRSERCCSLARIPMANLVAVLSSFDENIARFSLPQSFFCVDGILNILQNIVSNLVVYDNVIKRHIREELPFMATEIIIMEMVKSGGNRQVCHEEIRVLSQEAAKSVKLEGKSNDLLQRIKQSSYFKPIHDKLDELLHPEQFIGCCIQQVERFLEEEVSPVLNCYQNKLEGQVELHV